MNLLPAVVRKEVGWTPFFWLVFLGYLFVGPILGHESLARWLVLAGVLAIFLFLYYLSYRFYDKRSLPVLGAMVLLGAAYIPFNVGAACFFVYAACLLPFTNGGYAVLVSFLGYEAALLLVDKWSHHVYWGMILSTAGLSAALGAANLNIAEKRRANKNLQRAQNEIEHLAKTAERERIARDLHDVLGHTLSLITLKSELAGRLLDKNSAQQAALARNEIRDIEQTARQALAEVRQAIVGYRVEGFAAEIERAQHTLEAAGVKLHCENKPPMLAPEEETVLSLALREAVTNIVRHAAARSCRLHLSEENNYISLSVEDDGRGGVFLEGNGLRGMRERVEALGGYFTCEGSQGTRIMLRLPTKGHSEAVPS